MAFCAITRIAIACFATNIRVSKPCKLKLTKPISHFQISAQLGKGISRNTPKIVMAHASNVGLLHLPEEVLHLIFSYLTQHDMFWNLGFVCKALLHMVIEHTQILEIGAPSRGNKERYVYAL